MASRGNKSKVTKPIQNKQTALAGERSHIENPHKQTRKYNRQSDEEEEEGITFYTLTNKVETGGGQGSAEEKQDSQQTGSKIQEQDARGNELTE